MKKRNHIYSYWVTNKNDETKLLEKENKGYKQDYFQRICWYFMDVSVRSLKKHIWEGNVVEEWNTLDWDVCVWT